MCANKYQIELSVLDKSTWSHLTGFSENSLIVKNTSISSYSVIQTVLIQLIQFSITIDFVYTQLNVKTFLY